MSVHLGYEKNEHGRRVHLCLTVSESFRESQGVWKVAHGMVMRRCNDIYGILILFRCLSVDFTVFV